MRGVKPVSRSPVADHEFRSEQLATQEAILRIGLPGKRLRYRN